MKSLKVPSKTARLNCAIGNGLLQTATATATAVVSATPMQYSLLDHTFQVYISRALSLNAIVESTQSAFSEYGSIN